MSTELLEFVNKCSLKDVQRLLRQRAADPVYDNHAALRAVVKNHREDIVKQLLREEDVLKIANANHNEELRLAAKNNDKEIVKMLLNLTVLSTGVPDNNNEALRLTHQGGHYKVGKQLLTITRNRKPQ
ncbi:MAG TPA: hypothetical protein VNK03_03925 [Gammaproteobacteria bacterium]|nr:hypothetical protein [Gammaproteobacteria bacterium]